VAVGAGGARGRHLLTAMTADTRAWTPRVVVALTVLAAAAFVYVTAEVLPIGALPAIAADLHVGEAVVGTLMAGYALVAALTTVPLVRWTASWPRRRALVLTLTCLTVSQLISALAPNFAVLAGGRLLCALGHGLMWSVIAPVGARLVPPSHASRATAAVFAGTGLALVAGSPLTAAMSALWGWRPAAVVITGAAAVVTVAAWRTLPAMPAAGAQAVGHRPRLRRDLVTLSVLSCIGVTGHFVSYTFIAVVIRDVVGVRGPHAAWVLAGFGVAGLAGMAVMARPGDQRPRASVIGCLAVLVGAFGVLAWLATAQSAGATAVVGVAAVVVWGAASTALPPMLQAAVMRTTPDDPDGASGVYVTAFQVGIMAGAIGGGVLYEQAGPALMVGASAVLMATALTCVLIVRSLLDSPSVGARQ
jgi:predicted MFS family arabinose efflux permease